MNEIRVPRIDADINNPDQIIAALQSAGVQSHPIACCNWEKAFPYQPEAEVTIAHNGDHIILLYRVIEKELRCEERNNGNVWEDSCVEMFIMPYPETGIYYNFECNCGGYILFGGGADRHHRLRLNNFFLSMIGTKATICPKNEDNIEWHMLAVIPKELMFANDVIKDLSGLHAKGNFYKCGDKLNDPHFLSLSPIKTENPDFHRPEYFMPLIFE